MPKKKRKTGGYCMSSSGNTALRTITQAGGKESFGDRPKAKKAMSRKFGSVRIDFKRKTGA